MMADSWKGEGQFDDKTDRPAVSLRVAWRSTQAQFLQA